MTDHPTIHPTDGALGAKLLADGVLQCLACNTTMYPHPVLDHHCRCNPAECGWHDADLRLVAASFRRYEIPPGNIPDTVWVIPNTGHVPGLIHRTPKPGEIPETGSATGSIDRFPAVDQPQ